MNARLLWIVLVGCHGVSAEPQPQGPDRFRAVKKWRGTFKVTLDGDGSWAKTKTETEVCPDNRQSTRTTIHKAKLKLHRSSLMSVTLDEIDPTDTQISWRGDAKVSGGTSLDAERVEEFTPGCRSDCGRSVTTTRTTLKSVGRPPPDLPDAGNLVIDFETGRYDVTLLPFADRVHTRGDVTRASRPGCEPPDSTMDLGETSMLLGGANGLASELPDSTSAFIPYVTVMDPEALLRKAQDPAALAAAAQRVGIALPATGLTLTGQRTLQLRVTSLLPGLDDRPGTATATIQWTFEPADREELQVLVTPEGYDEWLPTAGANEHEGANRIGIKAQLVDRDGRPSTQKASKFRFELLDVSHQPGVAMNFPREPEATPDLQFEPAFNQLLNVSGTDKAELTGGDLAEARAVVSSFDWGAWGSIRVIAELPGGRVIVGHLSSDPSMELIRLPKREPGSKIGDFWKATHHVTGADVDDDETDPVGDGHRGDGFSLYEEARGFYENGLHIFGDPHKKELFIRDRVGGDSKIAIALMAQISELVVHDELTVDEFRPVDRVMNVNYDDETPRQGAQTGLLIAARPPSDAAAAVGGPGLPKTVEFIEIPTNLRRGGAFLRPRVSEGVFFPGDRYAATIAHELLHGCNVWHHGEVDEKAVWMIGGTADAQTITEGGRPISLHREYGSPMTLNLAPGEVEVPIGVPHGQHSGVENCVMRYDTAVAYRKLGDPSYVYWARETSGMGLCHDSAGTGVNKAGRLPRPRYFEAAPGKGDCVHQICVNDRMHP